ncbi:hypothetical protein [Streptomyces longwoodensis]|uniref:hypothetical protein n=1 Tax=Streptomyces longwoodensis TaxID=68231 RepID=UPI002250C38B|nr:hypothetical protein [Streptomyces longwoodensis]MCX5000925.1 hypothetical protein [Streptomyces longwoodensis]
MALIDDIEFYGSRVDAGDLSRAKTAQLLAAASSGGLTLLGAEQAIDDWKDTRARLEGLFADTVDTLRALENGRPVPEHVQRNGLARVLRSPRRLDP